MAAQLLDTEVIHRDLVRWGMLSATETYPFISLTDTMGSGPYGKNDAYHQGERFSQPLVKHSIPSTLSERYEQSLVIPRRVVNVIDGLEPCRRFDVRDQQFRFSLG